MPTGANNRGDRNVSPDTAVRQSDGEPRALTLDDLDRLRTLVAGDVTATVTGTVNAIISLGESVYSLIDRLADYQAIMEDILVELKIANAYRAEAQDMVITREDIE